MYFVGIDLAWSINNASGVSILWGDEEKAELKHLELKHSDDEILSFLDDTIGNHNALIAIDAPLIVPNIAGRRPAEAEIGKLFRKYNAGAYPANRTIFTAWYGGIRGEDLSSKLEKRGFIQNPYIDQFEKSRSFFEVYPHPSMVVLFNLSTILKYKPKPKRSYEFRYGEFQRYLDNLKALSQSDTKLIISDEILNQDLTQLKAKKLKNFEDKLDGIFCAYIAYYCWKNPNKCAVVGSMKEGYIMTPVFENYENTKN